MRKRRVEVNDLMQSHYVYFCTEPVGKNFDPEFQPELTPKEMLELGVFGGKYPKGSVSVTLRNDQPSYSQSQASSGVFIVYVAGADEPQQITLPPGATKTILFKNVADFGNMAQAVVAIWGKYRWFTPGVDVRAAQTVKAPVFGISGDGIDLFGAFRPVWKMDGSRVRYRSGVCTLNSVSVTPVVGEYEYHPLFAGKNPMGTCVWDWGPTAATANQLLYSETVSYTHLRAHETPEHLV